MNTHGTTNVYVLILGIMVVVAAIVMLSFEQLTGHVVLPNSVYSFNGQVKHVPTLGNVAAAHQRINVQVSDEPDNEDWVDALFIDASVGPQGVLLQGTFDVDALLDPSLSDGGIDGAHVLLTPFAPEGNLPPIGRDDFELDLQLSQALPNNFVGFGRISPPSGAGGDPGSGAPSTEPVEFSLTDPDGGVLGEGTIDFEDDDLLAGDPDVVALILGEEFDDDTCLQTSSDPLTECASLLDIFLDLEDEDFAVANATVSAPPSLVLLGLGLVLLFVQPRSKRTL